MATAQQISGVVAQMQGRSHALSTATVAGYGAARARLRTSIELAQRYEAAGRGTIPVAIWTAFQTTLGRSSYTFTAEHERRNAAVTLDVPIAHDPDPLPSDGGGGGGGGGGGNTTVVPTADSTPAVDGKNHISDPAWTPGSGTGVMSRVGAWLAEPNVPWYQQRWLYVTGAMSAAAALYFYTQEQAND